jgi:hypothetical protein
MLIRADTSSDIGPIGSVAEAALPGGSGPAWLG